MHHKPESEARRWKSVANLEGRVVPISGIRGLGKIGGDPFAKEGGDVAILYRGGTEDADHTHTLVEREGHRCLLLRAMWAIANYINGQLLHSNGGQIVA